MKYAYINFKGTSYPTSEVNPDDAWSRESTSCRWSIPDYFQTTDEDIYRAEPLSFKPKKGQDYFMVYAIWSTGDSFGSDERANCECFGIYETFEEAEARKDELSGPKTRDPQEWLPWYGYFESLDELEIKKITYFGKKI